ncbi:protein javelin [Drosophila miranda]|uniref:protein javelin n=1 Tax=Drosophila miranda TaxID=7229 RepID=UPI0007E626B9|nr:protein javelin [Drosophila miranda]
MRFVEPTRPSSAADWRPFSLRFTLDNGIIISIPTHRLNAKQQQQQQTTSSTIEQPLETPPADDTQSHRSSNNSGTCDSHQQQQQQQQQQAHPRGRGESRDFDLYYDNLKRLDALALGLSEQLHPWHNDKSDLESLNSDYFKNSLHQNHLEQQQQQQQGPSSLEFEALEQAAVNLLKERPRIYQSRRQQQQRNHHHHQCHLQRHLQQDTGGESCPEHSQSSVFPETTTSNSDDQTDSPSLSEQEYDLTHIEEIYQQQAGGVGVAVGANGVEETYEIISLTTTARTTRFEESCSDQEADEDQEGGDNATEESRLTPTSGEIPASDSDSTLKRGHGEHLIAYDSVYLSSEDSSDCTLIGESCESFEQRTFTSCGESGELETRSLLHISIEDTVYEPQAKHHKKGGATEEQQQQQPLLTTAKVEAQIFTQVLKVEHTPQNKPKILAVVEKRKLKQEEAQVKQQQQQPATDSFVVVSNLQENQYHSLPDVNIGVSLKVCESIDKELRSSYNQQRQQQRKDSKRGAQVVTRAETYDSIRRFGRAHQKARQKEHQEREREREREAAAAAGGGEKEAQRQEKPKITKEILAAEEPQRQQEPEEEEEPPLPPPPPPLTEEEQQEEEPQAEAEPEPEPEPEPVSIAQVEQPKEAPVIEVANFSKLIERRAQEIRERKDPDGRQEQRRQQQPQEEAEQETEGEAEGEGETLFHIIVTDAQNNIIEKEAIHEEHSSLQRPRTVRRSQSSSCGKPPERRILHSGGAPIYKARPIKVLAAGHSHGESTFGRGKMSRPQILHVVDGGAAAEGSLRRRSSARSIASTVSGAGGAAGAAVATEYLQKVDAVRCYWQKLAGNEPETPATDTDKGEQPPQEAEGRTGLHFQLGGKTTALQQQQQPPQPHSNDFCSMMPPPSIEIVELGEGAQKATIVSAAPDPDADEDDQDEAQFDHIRYKVLKSQQLIRSNILHHSTRNKKEAQFDGLIQYLQDYSFQELLSNNNVVIVEPVRTKIERPLQVGGGPAPRVAAAGPPKPPRVIHASGSQPRRTTLRQRQMGGGGGGGGAAAKRHFFYQPVRVNRELYEDELPDPDTVRNVRRFFEQNVMPSPGQGLLVQSQQKFGGSACQLSPKAARRAAQGSSYRYLTIDTSFGGDSSSSGVEQPKGMDLLAEEEQQQQQQQQQQQKHSKLGHWDTGSLSSGISSGDLSSPCGDCHPQESSPVMACKDVHVQDVVRRHNSNAANAKARAKFASRRTWCMGGASATSDSLYRQIYEQNLGHNAEDEQEEGHYEEEEEEDDDEDEEQAHEQDMCENYYVSNDILAKIRECGSTVTYYGGRVLDGGPASKMSPPQAAAQQTNGGTRSRIRQIEACNVCLPSERCEHRLQTKQSLEEQQLQSQDSYQGIKFKLVKSNSCSSRLELAGADTEVNGGAADSEVVRKMVHHFEATATDPVTINSQITEAAAPPRRLQVTVNNHINVQAVHRNESSNGGSHAAAAAAAAEATEISHPTYESQAMNIRLDVARGSASSASKVCRNKNVDLAYTLAKQPTPQARACSAPEGNQRLPQNEDVAVSKVVSKQQTAAAAAVNGSGSGSGSGRPQIIVPVEIHQQIQQQVAGPLPSVAPERRLSNASSSAASIVDKTVVRHYVANDRSIYERRKYDEIEFEEFEVYDPSKEPQEGRQERPPTDAELYDSLDDKM